MRVHADDDAEGGNAPWIQIYDQGTIHTWIGCKPPQSDTDRMRIEFRKNIYQHVGLTACVQCCCMCMNDVYVCAVYFIYAWCLHVYVYNKKLSSEQNK